MDEAFLFFIRLAQMLRQKLKGHEAVEFGVLGFIDDPHAAFAEFFKDFVMGYGFADHCTLMNLFKINYSG